MWYTSRWVVSEDTTEEEDVEVVTIGGTEFLLGCRIKQTDAVLLVCVDFLDAAVFNVQFRDILERFGQLKLVRNRCEQASMPNGCGSCFQEQASKSVCSNQTDDRLDIRQTAHALSPANVVERDRRQCHKLGSSSQRETHAGKGKSIRRYPSFRKSRPAESSDDITLVNKAQSYQSTHALAYTVDCFCSHVDTTFFLAKSAYVRPSSSPTTTKQKGRPHCDKPAAMNPHQKNKVDINAMSPDEQRLFRMYGKLPDKKNLLQNKLKGQERKYFDSGDYALSKAGKAGDVGVTSIGVEHPSPDTIPHLSSSPSTQTPGNPNGNPGLNLQPTQSHQSYVSGSPVKESSILQRGMSVDDQDGEMKSAMEKRAEAASSGLSPSSESDAVPIRQ
ncbi:hypothetical protein KCU99_g95, partial [Aureobasidium melanogenum]